MQFPVSGATVFTPVTLLSLSKPNVILFLKHGLCTPQMTRNKFSTTRQLMTLQNKTLRCGPSFLPYQKIEVFIPCKTVFLNRRVAAGYRALASIIAGRERRKETTICYKISLVQLITNLNVILYLSTCHNVYISVLMLFMIMP